MGTFVLLHPSKLPGPRLIFLGPEKEHVRKVQKSQEFPGHLYWVRVHMCCCYHPDKLGHDNYDLLGSQGPGRNSAMQQIV